MAGQSHVEQALVQAATAALYPAGTGAPSAIGAPCRIHRGWPLPAALDGDLARGIVTVSVSPVEHSLRLTTRYPAAWAPTGSASPSLTATVQADQVRFAGTAAPGQLAGVLADGLAAVYRVQANDTAESVAAQLAAQLRAGRIVQLSGAALILPGVRALRARVVADQPARRELRRQSQGFRIACFCPGPASRDAAVAAIDTALAAIRFLALADGTMAHLLREDGATHDNAGHIPAYRQDLIYRAEYATTEDANLPAMLFGAGSVNAAPFIG